MLRDGGSGYKAYVFEESIRRYAIDCKGRGHKEVITYSISKLRILYSISKLRILLSYAPQKPPKSEKLHLDILIIA
jgi:hypothetical protein